jgi:hypothetical protein
MSRQTAQPWWADVQHLRPRAEREADESALEQRMEGARRFARDAAENPRRSPHRVPTVQATASQAPKAPQTDPRGRATDRADRGRDALVFAADVAPESPRVAETADSLAELLGPDPVVEPAPVEDWLKPRHADARIENGRKTIEIRGQVDRLVGITVTPPDEADGSRRRRRRRANTIAGRPDRVAMWAVLLGIVLILVAAFSDSEAAHGAVRALEAGAAASGR